MQRTCVIVLEHEAEVEVAERGVEWRRKEGWSGGGRRGGVEEEGEVEWRRKESGV